jgi:Protein of unknown function (DUF3048) N-terminal domain/Protein of unknown function (DUF3048) C-terminal domain
LCLLLSTACGGSSSGVSSPATKPSPTFAPQITIFVTSPTPVPTNEPTAISLPPTLTPIPATPDAAQINPFTGLAVTDTATLRRRPLLIKVANTADIRPQNGLAQADVVVEHYAEGGITRFSALFLTHAPETVGSVRSCRLIDIELPVIFGSALTCSGSSNGVRSILLTSKYLFDQDGDPNHSVVIDSDLGPFECATCPMYRTNDRPMPNNLFANALNIYTELDKRGKNQPTEFKSWTFDAAPLTAGKPVTTVVLPYMVDHSTWKYDSSSGRWLRFEGKVPHLDATTGEQISAANVLVLFVQHTYTSIVEDVNGSKSIRIELWGHGTLKAFRDGQEVEGTWERPQDSQYILNLHVGSGNDLALKPGNTWIQLVPLDFKVTD